MLGRIPCGKSRFLSNAGKRFSYNSARFFIHADHAVEILHGYPAGAADEIVQANQDEDAAPDDPDGDVREVGVGAILGGREMVNHANERGLGVIGPEEVQKLGIGEIAVGRGVNGAEDAAVHGDQMRRENDLHGLAGDIR